MKLESKKNLQALNSLAQIAHEYTGKEVEKRIKVIFSNTSFRESLPQNKKLVEKNLRQISQIHPASVNRIKQIVKNSHSSDSPPKKKPNLYELSNIMLTKTAKLLIDNPYVLPGIFGPPLKQA
ncbi:MAG: hypothetical protein ChlgKO_02870 [Chlamydiales bacterium]